jgi:outer membrane receptor protein involved in Fe transport
MRQRHLMRTLLPTIATSLGMGSLVAYATDGEAPVLQEIVITAQKREEPLQKTAASITVLTGQDLKDRGAVSFEDYAASVPALSISAKSPGDQVFSIRGVSDTDTTGTNTQRTVGVYIDEMVVSNNYTSPDLNLYDTDRIEVLRGPQGTLYGDGSIGGIIRILTRKPDSKNFGADVSTEFSETAHGGFNWAANGMVNLPLTDGLLALRIVGYDRHNSGFIDNYFTGERGINDERTDGGRVALRYTPAEAWAITATMLFQEMHLGERSAVQVVPPVGDLQVGYPTPGNLDFRYWHANLTVEGDLGFADLLSATTYSEYKRDDRDDATDFIEAIFGARLPSSGHITDDTHSIAEELRLVSKPNGGRWDWLLGAYFFHINDLNVENDTVAGLEQLLAQMGLAGGPLDLGNDLIYSSPTTNIHTVYAGFADLTYHFTPRWSATLGLRYSYDKLEQEETQAGLAFQNPPFTSKLETSGSKWTSRGRLAYQATNDLLIYAQASQGYRLGGLNPVTPGTVNNPTYPRTYQSDNLWAYELGLKSQWLDHRLTFNTAVFYNHWTDVQQEQNTPDGFSFIGNAGEAHTQGIELEFAAHLGSHWEFTLGGAALEAELDKDVPALGAHKGDPLVGVPKYNGGASLTYSHRATERVNFFARIDGTYVSTIHKNFGRTDDWAGDYGLVNLRTGLQGDAFQVAVFCENLADRRANLWTNVIESADGSFYRKYESVVRPRTIGLSASYHW